MGQRGLRAGAAGETVPHAYFVGVYLSVCDHWSAQTSWWVGDEAVSLGRILERPEAVWLGYWRKQGVQAGPERPVCVCGWVIQGPATEHTGYLWPVTEGIHNVSMYVFSAKLLSSWSAREGSRIRTLVQLVFAQVLCFWSVLICMAGHGYMYMCIVCTCAHMPHNWMDVGMWCCSGFASVRLPDSATSNIDQSHIFSNSIPYIMDFV